MALVGAVHTILCPVDIVPQLKMNKTTFFINKNEIN